MSNHLAGGSSILSAHGGPSPAGGLSSNKMSQSMLWGRSDLREKFYSGSSQSNPWVRDLLWKRVIVEEKKLQGHDADPNPMAKIPPHMRSVHEATMKAQRAQFLQKKEERKKQKMMEMDIHNQVHNIVTGGSGGTLGGIRSRPATAQSTASGFGLPGAKHMRRAHHSGHQNRAQSRGSMNGSSSKKLPALNFDGLRKRSSRAASSRRMRSVRSTGSVSQQIVSSMKFKLQREEPHHQTNNNMTSSRTNYSNYSKRSSRMSNTGLMTSLGSSRSVTKLAKILRVQNVELKRGLQQQVRFFFLFSVFFTFLKEAICFSIFCVSIYCCIISSDSTLTTFIILYSSILLLLLCSFVSCILYLFVSCL